MSNSRDHTGFIYYYLYLKLFVIVKLIGIYLAPILVEV